MDVQLLVPMAQRGDDDAFTQLISMHKERLYKVAYAFLRNETDALEAIQEVTCRAYLKLGHLKQPAYFSTWLTRIMIHVCIDEQKRKKRWQEESADKGRAAFHSDNTDERLEIEQALARLTPPYRHVIILKYFEDLTVREISSLLGHPEGTIKTWLNKALVTLRKDAGKGW